MALFATFRMKINVSKYLTSILPKSDDYNIFIKKYLEGGMENGKFFVMLKKNHSLKTEIYSSYKLKLHQSCRLRSDTYLAWYGQIYSFLIYLVKTVITKIELIFKNCSITNIYIQK